MCFFPHIATQLSIHRVETHKYTHTPVCQSEDEDEDEERRRVRVIIYVKKFNIEAPTPGGVQRERMRTIICVDYYVDI